MTLDEIESAFRLGCCSSARLAAEGCSVCGPQMRALEAVREMARERDALLKLASDVESALCDAVDSGICAPPINSWRTWVCELLDRVRKREGVPSTSLAELQAHNARLVREKAAERLDFNRMLGEVRRQWDQERAHGSRIRERAERAEAARNDAVAELEALRTARSSRDPARPHPNEAEEARLRAADHFHVWPWASAPESLRALSTNGGDEDWVAIVPHGMGCPSWIEGKDFGWCRVDRYEISIGTVYIGSHS